MRIGRLGDVAERGKYVDNDIPGAKDASEAYDLRYFNYRCSIGSLEKTGPRGIVTHFVPDTRTAKETVEWGEPRLEVQDRTVCILQPGTQVISVEGTRSYFNWYDACCTALFIEGDCATLLEHVKDERETQQSRRPFLVRECVTDWPRWALDRIMELLKEGVGLATAAGQVKKLLEVAGQATDLLDGLPGSGTSERPPAADPPQKPQAEITPQEPPGGSASPPRPAKKKAKKKRSSRKGK